MNETYRNPILPGFHPDPSIVRVGDWYYLATSTFEWFPGVAIYASKDLVHWQGVARPLDRLSLLDMRGEEASCGVWAPCLTHDGSYFYLVYSDTRCKSGRWWDVNNYVIRAKEIDGPWSERVFLNRSGFDPSLFHDTDGRKWLLNMIQDPRPGRNRFAGIVIQEYDAESGKRIGECRQIHDGSSLGSTEGPHLYHHDGWYVLMCAEGGTSWKHAVTTARSRNLFGPYENDPQGPLLTSWQNKGVELEKAGHGCWVETPEGEHWLVHLCSRADQNRRCMLGRETALQPVEWTSEGWLRLKGDRVAPYAEAEKPNLPSHPLPAAPTRHEFDEPELPFECLTLREPPSEDWCSLTERPGWLRLRGRLSMYSNYEQSLVGRRIQSFTCEAETRLDYEPTHYLQTAGLAAFYDDQDWLYLAMSRDEKLGRVLRVMVNRNSEYSEPLEPIPVPGGEIRLKAVLRAPTLRFYWASAESDAWEEVDVELDASQLSDDTGKRYRFTGAFFVLCAQDHTTGELPADFDYFEVKALG